MAVFASVGCVLTTDRPPLVGVPHRLRLALEVIGVELLDVETGALDLLGDVASQVTATGETLVQGLQALLPADDLLVASVAVFHEVERASGLEDAPHLSECRVQVRDRATRPRREHRVELA